MLVSYWLDPAHSETTDASLFRVFSDMFDPRMFPMGIVYGLIGATVCGLLAFQRSVVAAQRDHPAIQLDVAERCRSELEPTLNF